MRILIAEDDPALAETLRDGLRREGHQVTVANDGRTALDLALTTELDVVLLDRDLPRLHGDDVARSIRGIGLDVGILMLTAASDVTDRVEGLDLGADDYLAKPFAYVELLARLRALGRRQRSAAPTFYEIGDLRIDVARSIAERAGRPLNLTRREYGVLESLMHADGGFVSVDTLLDEVWGIDEGGSRGALKTTIYTLRGKLGHPDPIESVTGRGYRVVAP